MVRIIPIQRSLPDGWKSVVKKNASSKEFVGKTMPGFRTKGDEEKTFHSLRSVQTGLLFADRDPYTVKTVVTDSPVDKKGIDIKPGDILVAVNNKKVGPGVNSEYYFSASSAVKNKKV